MDRQEIKKGHEKAVITAFLKYYNEAYGSHYVIIETPESPDAIVSDGSSKKWVEHCDAYRSPDEAKEDYDANHCHTRQMVYPDSQIVNALLRTLQKKFDKESYSKIHSELGPGILVMVACDPLFSESTREEIVEVLTEVRGELTSRGYFGQVYLTWNSSESFMQIWPQINEVELKSLRDAANDFREQYCEAWDELVKTVSDCFSQRDQGPGVGLLWSRIADGRLQTSRFGGKPREGFLRGGTGNPTPGPKAEVKDKNISAGLPKISGFYL
ncbi:MAG: hypothetical protein KKH28_06525 [Elusimicrobia bacterium]|nr:hypothetical protein [Elusimicrobiota bacterium]